MARSDRGGGADRRGVSGRGARLAGATATVIRQDGADRGRPAPGMVQLGCDLQVPEDHLTYLRNADVINALIAAEPDTPFAAGWIITLQRAEELGLTSAAAHL